MRLLSYVAQTEREFSRQRQAEGIAAAKERGVQFGRWPRFENVSGKEISPDVSLWNDFGRNPSEGASDARINDGILHKTAVKKLCVRNKKTSGFQNGTKTGYSSLRDS